MVPFEIFGFPHVFKHEPWQFTVFLGQLSEPVDLHYTAHYI